MRTRQSLPIRLPYDFVTSVIVGFTPSDTLTTLLSFDGPNGTNPYATLVQATNGNFYGTTADYAAKYVRSRQLGHWTK
jgi:hypothetical protein